MTEAYKFTNVQSGDWHYSFDEDDGGVYDPLYSHRETVTLVEQPTQQHEQHKSWCASLTQMLTSMPPKPAPCNCKEQQQEPYGWKVFGVSSLFMGEFAEHEAKSEARRIGGNSFAFPLYTSPPASKPWVGLTDEERGQVYAGWRFNGSNSSNLELCRAIEAKLKEKNNG